MRANNTITRVIAHMENKGRKPFSYIHRRHGLPFAASEEVQELAVAGMSGLATSDLVAIAPLDLNRLQRQKVRVTIDQY